MRTSRLSLNFVILTLAHVILFGTLSCSGKKFPEKFTADREAFDQSIQAFSQAADMFTTPEGRPIIQRTIAQEQQYLELLNQGLQSSKKVGDGFLDYVHPDLKQMYRNNLIAGKTLYFEGAVKGDRFTQVEGSAKVMRWVEFWDSHRAEIVAKTYPSETSYSK